MTNEERLRTIRARTAARRRALRLRRAAAWSAVVCLTLLVGLGVGMAELSAMLTQVSAAHPSGAASLLASNQALGYILVGILSFLLGIVVTLLLYAIRRQEESRTQEEQDDEL